MPQSITLYRIFVSAPSDVTEEKIIIDGILTDWNLQHGLREEARVELIDWRTHTWPAAGERPQALINKQAFDTSDIVVAVFRGRIGTPTGKAESGTVEEIERGMKQGKQVMVYFGPGKTGRKGQSAQIETYKRRFGQQALYYVFSDVGSFEKAFRLHLAHAMNAVLQNTPPKLQ